MKSKTATSLRCDVSIAVDRMLQRIEALEADVTRLEKENAELWSTVHSYQDAMTKAEAACTGGR